MVRPLVAGLAKFEKSEPSMSLYFPDLINSIDVAAEQKRLATFVFKSEAEMNAANGTPTKQVAADTTTELDRWLLDGNREIANQKATEATATFEKVLEKYPGEPRAYFGLAVASLMNQDAERAEQIFQSLVEAASRATPAAGAAQPQSATAANINPPDPSVLAWSHVYLGRLQDVADERDQAVIEYRAALAVPGAPEAALVAAQRGVDKPYAPATSAGPQPAASPKN
jgi:tetratricopeptide (TPR) repeat protein